MDFGTQYGHIGGSTPFKPAEIRQDLGNLQLCAMAYHNPRVGGSSPSPATN